MNYHQHVPKSAEHLVLRDPLLNKKKQKCLGNRKLYNFTLKCRAKGMTDHAIEMLLLLKKANTLVQAKLQNTYEDPKNASPLINTISNILNMSTLIGNQNCTNEYQHTGGHLKLDSTIEPFLCSQSTAKGKWPSPSTTRFPKRCQRYNLCNDHWKQMSKLIPNYKKLSPYQFKDALMKVLPASSQHHIKECYVNVPMLHFIQQRTELVCSILQLKFEQDYWNSIDNLISMPVVIWLSEAGKDVTKKNSINWDHTKTKLNIQHRQTIIQNRLKEAEHSLNFHLQQSYPFDCELNNKTALVSFLNVISHGVVTLAENSLYYFRTNFEQKKILLDFDITDARLVKLFYDLNPTQEQISSVQKIWRAKVKSCKQTIRRKKKYHSSSIMHTISMIDFDQDQQKNLRSIQSFTTPMQKIIEARLTNIEERTQQLMKFIYTINDNVFF
ncbi:unnamed protein product [Rotaria sp. Silwood1]|nr:unnamed protein product [Rotaria sp. Silwood1]